MAKKEAEKAQKRGGNCGKNLMFHIVQKTVKYALSTGFSTKYACLSTKIKTKNGE